MFCDVVGSTPLGERLDPEALRGVLTRFAAEIERVAERHGGRAGALMGDGLMCVFGVPVAHEDDALRAVRAAAEMAAAVARLNEQLRADLRVELAVRIGVNTGEVVASAGSPVLGDAINVAARLEQAGAAGEILDRRGYPPACSRRRRRRAGGAGGGKGQGEAGAGLAAGAGAARCARIGAAAGRAAARAGSGAGRDPPGVRPGRGGAHVPPGHGAGGCRHRQVAAGPGGGGAAGGPRAGANGALPLLRRRHHVLTTGRGGAGTHRWREQSGVRVGRRG